METTTMTTTMTSCASETRRLCAREADLVALLESASVRDESALRQRRQRVRDCLVGHADELSPECVAALVGNVATQASVLPTHDDANEAQVDQPAPVSDSQPEPQEDQTTTTTTTTTDQATMKPVVQVFHETPAPVDVVQQQPPQYVQSDGDGAVEVRIFLINHPGHAAAAAAPPPPQYIRIGGDSNQHVDGDVAPTSETTSGMVISPWLWVAILPFMCIGIYVSAVQTLAFVRRRRDFIYRVGNTQYMPIPTSLNPTK